MMIEKPPTPIGYAIERRNWKFGRGKAAQRWWHGGDPGRTAFFNALSSTFPVGEKFFMSAVRYYRNDAPETLRAEIDAFIFQESTHSREPVFFNQQARAAGYDLTSSEEADGPTTAWANRRPPTMHLPGTCALARLNDIGRAQ